MLTAHVFISGSVQGVGYRGFVKSNAQKLGLTGWVRNTEDGGVEVTLQGEKEKIERLVELCKKVHFWQRSNKLGLSGKIRQKNI